MQNRFADVKIAVVVAGALLFAAVVVATYKFLSNQASRAVAPMIQPVSISISEAFTDLSIKLAKVSASFDINRDIYAFLSMQRDCSEVIVVQGSSRTVLDRFRPPVVGTIHLSRDGQRLVFVAASLEDDQASGVYVYDIPTRKRTKLYTGVGYNSLLSPDGCCLIWETERGVRVIDLETKQVHGSWAKHIISENFSPDGELLVEAGSSRRRIVAWNALRRASPPATAQPLKASALNSVFEKAVRVAWSPDGQWIAYVVAPQKHQEELWLTDTHRKKTRLVHRAVGISNLRWASDSQTLFFVKVDSTSAGGVSAARLRYTVANGTCASVDW